MTEPGAPQDPTRDHKSLTAAAEKRLLVAGAPDAGVGAHEAPLRSGNLEVGGKKSKRQPEPGGHLLV